MDQPSDEDVRERMINTVGVLQALSKSSPKCSITRVAYLVSKLLHNLQNCELDPVVLRELRAVANGDNHNNMQGVAVNYMAKAFLVYADSMQLGLASSSSYSSNRPLFAVPTDSHHASLTPSSQGTSVSGGSDVFVNGVGLSHINSPHRISIKSEMMIPDDEWYNEEIQKELEQIARGSKSPVRIDTSLYGGETHQDFNKPIPAPRKYICRHCGKACENQQVYASHVRYAHPKTPSAANGATPSNGSTRPDKEGTATPVVSSTKRSRPPKDPNAVASTPRPYNCRYCGLFMESQQAYASHVRYAHPKPPAPPGENDPAVDRVIKEAKHEKKTPGTSDKSYRCRRCDKVFDNAPGIAGHTRHCMLAHPGDGDNRTNRKRKLDQMHQSNEVQPDRSQLFVERGLDSAAARTCAYCGEVLHSIHAVDKHIRKKHQTQRQEIYRCTECNRKFMTLGGLENHWLYYMDCPTGRLEVVQPVNKSENSGIEILLEGLNQDLDTDTLDIDENRASSTSKSSDGMDGEEPIDESIETKPLLHIEDDLHSNEAEADDGSVTSAEDLIDERLVKVETVKTEVY